LLSKKSQLLARTVIGTSAVLALINGLKKTTIVLLAEMNLIAIIKRPTS